MLCHIQLETSHEVKPTRTADQRNLRSQGKIELGSRKYLEKRKDYDFKTNARRSGRVEKTEDSERLRWPDVLQPQYVDQ